MNKSGLGQLVRRIVKRKDLSLRDVERAAGGEIANSTISRIMNGVVTNITVDKLISLAHAIDEDPHVLFTAAYGRAPLSADKPPTQMDAATLVDLMQRIVADPHLAAILQVMMELRPDEYPVILRFLSLMNQDTRRGQESGEKEQLNGQSS